MSLCHTACMHCVLSRGHKHAPSLSLSVYSLSLSLSHSLSLSLSLSLSQVSALVVPRIISVKQAEAAFRQVNHAQLKGDKEVRMGAEGGAACLRLVAQVVNPKPKTLT